MSFPIATLASENLPLSFSYQPYIPRKRTAILKTTGGVVTQTLQPEFIHGEDTFSWTIAAADKDTFQFLYNKYKQSGTMVFTGYWGENLTVEFWTFEPPTIRGTVFSLAGSFRVVCVNDDYEVSC
jgi:hypothetical protein